jgi:hypothetical protein
VKTISESLDAISPVLCCIADIHCNVLIIAGLAVRMLSVRHVACYPDHVELAGTPPWRVVLGPTETLT